MIFNTGIVLAAEDSSVYTALGDSITTGNGLEGYTEGVTPNNSYVALVQKEMEAKEVYNLAVNGLTSTALLTALEAGEYNEKIAKAEWVTLTIGANDLLMPFMKVIQEEFNCSIADLPATITELNNSNSMMLLKHLLSLKAKLENNAELLAACEAFAGTDTTEGNFQKIIKKLKELAPNAKICVTNIYNPYQEVGGSEDGIELLSFSSFTETYIAQLNKAFSEKAKDYMLVDIKTLFEHSKEKLVNVDFETYNLDPHPNAAGHAVIAKAVSGAFKKEQNNDTTDKVMPEKGSVHTVGVLKYKITKASEQDGTVVVTAPAKKTFTKVVVPDSVKIKDYTFTVVSVSSNAFKNNAKLKSVTLGKNVTKVGSKSFYGCKKLKNITIKSLSLKTIGKNAFKNINSKASITVPAKKFKEYKKLLKNKGQKSTVKIIK